MYVTSCFPPILPRCVRSKSSHIQWPRHDKNNKDKNLCVLKSTSELNPIVKYGPYLETYCALHCTHSLPIRRLATRPRDSAKSVQQKPHLTSKDGHSLRVLSFNYIMHMLQLIYDNLVLLILAAYKDEYNSKPCLGQLSLLSSQSHTPNQIFTKII